MSLCITTFGVVNLTIETNSMEKEDILKFTNSVILLSKLFTTVEDRFLKQKLHDKLSDFVSAFVVEQHSVNVAQTELRNISKNVAQFSHVVQREYVAQRGHKDLLNSINNILDYLEHLAHISKDNTTPLLVAQRNLLKFKLHILQKSKIVKKAKEESETSLTSDVQRPFDVANFPSEVPVTASVAISKSVLSAQRKNNFGTGTSNKEQIFNYIKKTPDIRTKEIMSEFSALSGRTVKRSLKELTDEGFLKKRSDGAAVYYTCG